ncbi:hypothetical protein [Kitasatospora sp. LaBMicrA B282]|uniref:hypothetical protein n=1 Tax=Kitasatospora sp. LaBMicrA B282 TaxID=3420949 RepID=UPI003D0ED084
MRVGGRWVLGLLTVWCRPWNSGQWIAHVRWGKDDHGDPATWGWLLYDPATIRPVPAPPDDAPAPTPVSWGRG